jgi:putative redox protein
MNDVKTAHLVWQGVDLDFRTSVGSGYEFDFSSGERGAGGRPMEMLLAAVAGCTAMDVISILQKMRQAVSDFQVEIRGIRAAEHPKVYTGVDIAYIVRGKAIDAKSVETAIELSQTKYCSASIMFQQAGVDVRTSYRIEEEVGSE